MDVNTLYEMLEPYIVRTIQTNKISLNSSSVSGGGMEQHALYGPYHTGQLDESQALWVPSMIGLRISDHAAQVDVHHAKLHDILDVANHTVTGGAALDLIGQSAANTLARITPTSNPGAASAVLKTDGDGYLNLTKLITPSIESPVADALSISAYNRLSLSSGEGIIQVLPSSSLQSDNFTSQLAGWRMTYAGELDARYMYADQLTIKLFMADYEVALAGSQMITKSITTTSRPFVTPYPGSYMYLYVNDLPSAEGMACFEEEDRVRLREYSRALGSLNTNDCWGTVSAYTPSGEPKEQRWSYQRFGTSTISTVAQTGTRTTANVTGTTLTPTKPSGVTTNSFLIALVVNSDVSAIITPPSGWSLFGTSEVTGMRASVYYKFAGGSEPSSYSWTFSLSNNASVSLHSYSGVSTSHPIGSYNIVTDTEPSTQLKADSNYGASEGDMFMIFAGIANANAAVDNHPDMTERTDQGYGGMRMWVSQYLTAQSDWVGDMTVYVADGDYAAPRVTFAINLLPAITAGGLTLYTGYMTPGKTIAKESHALDYGMPGNGWIESTTVDGAYGSNSPYTRVVSWATHPAVDPVVRSQLGNLKGIFGVDNEFGLFAGNGVTDADSYVRLSSYALRLNNVPIQLWNTGQQKVNIDAEGIDVWIGNGSGDKRVSWDGSNLSVKGSVTISDVSGFSGSGYLKIGTGTKDSTLDGWQFDSSEIVGQLDGVDQVVMNTSGKILAGASSVLLDGNGLTIIGDTTDVHASQARVKGVTYTKSDGTTIIGRSLGYFLSGTDTYGVELYSRSPDEQNSFLKLSAERANVIYGGGSAGNPKITMFSGSDESISFYASGQMNWYRNSSASSDMALSTSLHIRLAANVGTNTVIVTNDGTLSVGNITVDYSPIDSTWNTTGSTLLLNALNYTTIGFHDSGARVDYIRAGGGVITVGYDGGYGAARVDFGGVVGTGWSNLSFGSGWANYGSSYQNGEFKKVGDLVFLRGLIYRFTGSGTTIATLPSGCRPPATMLFGVHTNTGLGRVDINNGGDIFVVSGGTDWIQLNGLVFSTVA
jgi:hypothetical protein